MASSSSNSFNSFTASESSRETTPEFDSGAAHEACAPLHWDAEEWDFRAWSEDDESLTDGEDLQFLLDGELEDKDDDEDESWDGYDSSLGEEEDDESTEEDSMAGSFLRARSSDKDDDGDDGGDSDDGADSDDGSSGDDGARCNTHFLQELNFCPHRSAYKNAYQIVVHMKSFPKINLV
jgi:hypothetical protein